jgi:hypothetical protein
MEWSARAAVDGQGWQLEHEESDISLFVLAAATLPGPKYTRPVWSVAVECRWHSRIA